MSDRFRDDLQAALAPTYALERELTPGGMSRVFVATEPALGRRVAIKVLLPELAAGLSKKRFSREIQLAASLQQANIVPVFSTGEVDGLPFYVMPLVDGQSLRHRLDDATRLKPSDAVAVLRDVARALAFAHERGVVHRDIKPENVLLSGATAVVTDFGIAKAITAARDGSAPSEETTQTQAGMAVGTPAYMAPEQIAGDPSIDHRADIYSYGCLAYEILTGETPFGSLPARAQLTAHLRDRPTPIEQVSPKCPPSLARLVMRCLEKDPAQRPTSAQEILGALETTTGAPNAMSMTWRRIPRRHRRVVSTTAIVGAAFVVALSVREWRSARRADSGGPTLAVLPFVNIGGDTTKDVWADGLTDGVGITLAKGGRFRLATTSVDRYRGRRNLDVASTVRALGVRYGLRATVLPDKSKLRVVATLTDAAGTIVWRDQFEPEARDYISTLNSITASIATAVHQRVFGSGLDGRTIAVASAGTADSAAYDLYVRGKVMLGARGPGVRRAAQLFEAAIQRDPNFARAHSALSAALAVLPNFADSTAAELYPRATAAARRAIQLDSTLGEPHTSLALLHMSAFEWTKADSEFRRAMLLDPSDAFTYMHYGRFLIYTGRLREAEPVMGRAVSTDPTSPVIGAWRAVSLEFIGNSKAAYREIDRALELDSTSVPPAYFGAAMAASRGQLARARALAEVSWRPNGIPRPAPWPGSVAFVYAALRDRESLEQVRQYLDSAKLSRAYAHSARAMLAIALRDTSVALTELERANAAGEFWPSAPIIAGQVMDFLGEQPRFVALLKQARLDEFFPSTRGVRPK